MTRLSVAGSKQPSMEFSLEQDGNEVNLLANGEVIGYFANSSEGVYLELIKQGLPKGFALSDKGYIKVVE